MLDQGGAVLVLAITVPGLLLHGIFMVLSRSDGWIEKSPIYAVIKVWSYASVILLIILQLLDAAKIAAGI